MHSLTSSLSNMTNNKNPDFPLQENKIRDAQGDEECNSVFTKGSRPTGRKIRKAKKVLWKGPDSDDEEGSIVRMRAPSQSTKLPVCACGLFPTY